MTAQLFLEIFERDINKLKEEISLYKNEQDLWKTEKHISNSAGTLTLHLIGNLNHFIGAVLSNTGYIREREKEFSDTNVPREKMLHDLNEVLRIVKNILSKMSATDLQKDFPVELIGKRKTMQALLILTAHFNYHLGQINYHRRILASR